MSEATVKAHLSHVLTKLNAANRVQVAIVMREFRPDLSPGPAPEDPFGVGVENEVQPFSVLCSLSPSYA